MRADRLLRLLALLQRHRRIRAADLAARLEVSERTILRDMEALSAAGVPVWTERGHGGGCVLLDRFTTDASGLTTDEAQALFSWAGGVNAADLGLGPALSGALAKVAASVPGEAVSRGEALGAVVLADRRRWFAEAEAVPVLPQLREAAQAGVRVRITHTSPGGNPGQRTVDPHGLVDQSGRWYLVASHRGRLRSYRVSRIDEVRVLAESVRHADPRPLAEIWAELRSTFERGAPQPVTCELQVSAEVAREFWVIARHQLVEDTHPTPTGDGTWSCTIRARRAAHALVLAWHPGVRLLGPPELLADLRTHVAGLTTTYY